MESKLLVLVFLVLVLFVGASIEVCAVSVGPGTYYIDLGANVMVNDISIDGTSLTGVLNFYSASSETWYFAYDLANHINPVIAQVHRYIKVVVSTGSMTHLGVTPGLFNSDSSGYLTNDPTLAISTSTPIPTYTPTPMPTSTSTIGPSSTPMPTVTPGETPLSSSTPGPTNVPGPTATPYMVGGFEIDYDCITGWWQQFVDLLRVNVLLIFVPILVLIALVLGAFWLISLAKKSIKKGGR